MLVYLRVRFQSPRFFFEIIPENHLRILCQNTWPYTAFKTNRTQIWLTFLVSYHHWKVVVFHKKSNLYPTKKEKIELTFLSALHLVLIFPIKKNEETAFGNSWRHKVLHLGYANVVIKVLHISRMWLWWVWKNRRPKWMEINTCFSGGDGWTGIDPFWGDQSWCKCMVIWGISLIVDCLGQLSYIMTPGLGWMTSWWCGKIFLFSPPSPGEVIRFDLSIFCKWVGLKPPTRWSSWSERWQSAKNRGRRVCANVVWGVFEEFFYGDKKISCFFSGVVDTLTFLFGEVWKRWFGSTDDCKKLMALSYVEVDQKAMTFHKFSGIWCTFFCNPF